MSTLDNFSKIDELLFNFKLKIIMTFQYIKPSEEELKKMQEFRDKFEKMKYCIKKYKESGRGKSLALTKLEEANMRLNKAITKND